MNNTLKNYLPKDMSKRTVNAIANEILGIFDDKELYNENLVPEIKAVREKCTSLYWNNPTFEDIRFDLDMAEGRAFIYERRVGFLNGFMAAAKLFCGEGVKN